MKGVLTMIVRNCAGGVVFFGDKVLLLKNEKGEWVLPKGVIRNGDSSDEVALRRVREETGVEAQIISTIGHTNYEFYSVTRQRPVCNKITWYIMKSSQEQVDNSQSEEQNEVGFFNIDDAIRMITYSQDKSLLNLSYKKLRNVV